MRNKFLCFLLIIIPAISFSQSLRKALTSLNAGDYEAAFSSLHSLLQDKEPNPAAQYLLARIFFTNNYSKHNLDSANNYILKSESFLSQQWKEKDLKKFQEAGWNANNVAQLIQQINEQAFHTADSINTATAWDHFISTYTSSARLNEGKEKRNAATFAEALRRNEYSSFEDFLKKFPEAANVGDAKARYESNLYKTKTADSTWQSYKSFGEKYPNSPYSAQAKANYERLLFLDKTKDHSVSGYGQFIQTYPESPYITQAQDSIYSVSTRDRQVKSYMSFITSYPANPNVEKAWQRVYEIEAPKFSVAAMRQFLVKYPQFPHRAEVEKEIRLAPRQLEKFEKGGLYGFVDLTTRETMIPARFTEAAPFSEGLSVVKLPCGEMECKYEYVTMDGRIISNYPWGNASDFTEGHAIAAVGNCDEDSCKYGFINRFGEWIVQPLYDVAYDYSEGMACVRDKHKGYGYIDLIGRVVVPLKYTNAGTFSEGVASVQDGESARYEFIDKSGKTVIAPSFGRAGAFREGLAPAANDSDLWGFIDHTGKWVIQPQYVFALPFIDGVARVVVRTRDPKDAHVWVMNDKEIDKRGKMR